MHQGLSVGLGLLKNELHSGISSFLLFTDGHPDTNAGISELVEQSMGFLPKGCTLHTFGYGSDHNGTFLTNLAQAGKGSYYFLEKPDDIPNSFADVLGGLLSVVAQNLVLEVSPCEHVKLLGIHTTFVKESETKVKIPDLYGEEKRDVLVQIEVFPVEEPIPNQPLITATLNYFNVVSSSLVQSPVHLTTIPRPQNLTEEDAQVNIKVSQQENRVRCADALLAAKNMADKGELDQARNLLEACISQVSRSTSAAQLETQLLVNDLKETIGTLQKKSDYRTLGEKKLSMTTQEHRLQRSLTGRAESASYSTSSKRSMQATSLQSRSTLSESRYERRAQASGAPSVRSMTSSSGVPPARTQSRRVMGGGSTLDTRSLKSVKIGLDDPIESPKSPETPETTKVLANLQDLLARHPVVTCPSSDTDETPTPTPPRGTQSPVQNMFILDDEEEIKRKQELMEERKRRFGILSPAPTVHDHAREEELLQRAKEEAMKQAKQKLEEMKAAEKRKKCLTVLQTPDYGPVSPCEPPPSSTRDEKENLILPSEEDSPSTTKKNTLNPFPLAEQVPVHLVSQPIETQTALQENPLSSPPQETQTQESSPDSA